MFRHLLMILAMLSMAVLPGPSHALSFEDGAAIHGPTSAGHIDVDHLQDRVATRLAPDSDRSDRDTGCPDHEHGKCCVTACCMSSCLPFGNQLAALPTQAWASISPPMPGEDTPRDDALLGHLKRPPKSI